MSKPKILSDMNSTPMRYTSFRRLPEGKLTDREELNNLDELNEYIETLKHGSTILIVGIKEDGSCMAQSLLKEGTTSYPTQTLNHRTLETLSLMGFNVINQRFENPNFGV